MKRKVLLAAAATAVVFTLAACANTANTSAAGEMVVPETSSQELLVGSLEYLLQERGENIRQSEVEVLKMFETDASVEEMQSKETEEVRKVQATIYYGNSGSLDLKQEVTGIEQLTPENLIDSLAKHNIVSLDTKVNSFEEEDCEEGKVLKLDLSKAFREYLRTMSKNSEKVILASVVDTFLDAYEAQAIQITVEGDLLETSHGSYHEPIEFTLPEAEE